MFLLVKFHWNCKFSWMMGSLLVTTKSTKDVLAGEGCEQDVTISSSLKIWHGNGLEAVIMIGERVMVDELGDINIEALCCDISFGWTKMFEVSSVCITIWETSAMFLECIVDWSFSRRWWACDAKTLTTAITILQNLYTICLKLNLPWKLPSEVMRKDSLPILSIDDTGERCDAFAPDNSVINRLEELKSWRGTWHPSPEVAAKPRDPFVFSSATWIS